MTESPRRFYLRSFLLATVFVASCAATNNIHQLPPRTIAIDTGRPPRAAMITLELSADFESYAYTYKLSKDEQVYPIGAALSSDAERLVRSIFSNVTVTHANLGQVSRAGSWTISPRVSGVNVPSGGMWASHERTVGFPIEWTVKNSAGEIVWVKTIVGEGRGPIGNTASYANNIAKDMNTAITDALVKSHIAIEGSEEIRIAEPR